MDILIDSDAGAGGSGGERGGAGWPVQEDGLRLSTNSAGGGQKGKGRGKRKSKRKERSKQNNIEMR
jgi:hypothetical protein